MVRLGYLFRPLRPIYEAIERRICLKAFPHFAPIGKFHPNDVFIVGYPKSGNTWMQNLVAGVVYGIDPQYAPDTLIQELVPDVHYKRYYKRFRTPMFFKSHHLPRPEYKRVVYLLRDGRDVMVSYYYYLTAVKNKEIDFLNLVKHGPDHPFGKWHEHVEAWLSNPYNVEMIVIKYENLINDPMTQLQELCEFIGIKRSTEFLEIVAKGSSFDKMRWKEKTYGSDNLAWPRDKPFVRRGKVGTYKDEMPKNVLMTFLKEAGATLSKCGYA